MENIRCLKRKHSDNQMLQLHSISANSSHYPQTWIDDIERMPTSRQRPEQSGTPQVKKPCVALNHKWVGVSCQPPDRTLVCSSHRLFEKKKTRRSRRPHGAHTMPRTGEFALPKPL